jgi:hypothetical protein
MLAINTRGLSYCVSCGLAAAFIVPIEKGFWDAVESIVFNLAGHRVLLEHRYCD